VVRLSRTILITVGIASAVLCAALLVRQIVLRVDPDLVWPLPSWWTWLYSPEHPVRAGAAAALCGLGAIICLWLAANVVRSRGTAVRRLDVSIAGSGSTSMEAAAIDGLLGGGVRSRIPEILSAKAHLFRSKTGYDAAVAVTARPCDVAELHARVLQAVRADLQITAGVTVNGLELEIDRFVLEDRGES
jgi:hypothetical protein